MSNKLLYKEKARYRQHNELGGIEMLEASYFKQHFSRHSHEGYTFGVIETGAQRFYRTGSNNVAPTGSIILINADDIRRFILFPSSLHRLVRSLATKMQFLIFPSLLSMILNWRGNFSLSIRH